TATSHISQKDNTIYFKIRMTTSGNYTHAKLDNLDKYDIEDVEVSSSIFVTDVDSGNDIEFARSSDYSLNTGNTATIIVRAKEGYYFTSGTYKIYFDERNSVKETIKVNGPTETIYFDVKFNYTGNYDDISILLPYGYELALKLNDTIKVRNRDGSYNNDNWYTGNDNRYYYNPIDTSGTSVGTSGGGSFYIVDNARYTNITVPEKAKRDVRKLLSKNERFTVDIEDATGITIKFKIYNAVTEETKSASSLSEMAQITTRIDLRSYENSNNITVARYKDGAYEFVPHTIDVNGNVKFMTKTPGDYRIFENIPTYYDVNGGDSFSKEIFEAKEDFLIVGDKGNFNGNGTLTGKSFMNLMCRATGRNISDIYDSDKNEIKYMEDIYKNIADNIMELNNTDFNAKSHLRNKDLAVLASAIVESYSGNTILNNNVSARNNTNTFTESMDLMRNLGIMDFSFGDDELTTRSQMARVIVNSLELVGYLN
ncbi:MAG: hypothetical protein ACK5LT_01605, partial [Lachnospirales bacterium]